ncbi:MAG: hypothetical protein AAB929_03895 [Patescibacteria group bacterium]
MLEQQRPYIESFANLVNEGLRLDVPQPASYWTAEFKTSEGFRETVLKTPFQTLGVYLIAKAHEKNITGDQTENRQKGNNHTLMNAETGFATMMALRACEQAYTTFLSQSISPPRFGDVLNVIPLVIDQPSEPHSVIKSVRYTRGLWSVDTPPQPDQIERLAQLNRFMQELNANVQQYLGKTILFTHGLEAMRMGAEPDSIDTIISHELNLHHFNSARSSLAGKFQGHVQDFYTPEKAPTINRGHPILSKELIELIVNDRQCQELGSDVFRLRTRIASDAHTKKRPLSLREKQHITDKLIGDSTDWERLMAELKKIEGGDLIPLAIPILAEGIDNALLQQHAHELLLTRDDMGLVNVMARNHVIETQQPCSSDVVFEFMNHAYQVREKSMASNME